MERPKRGCSPPIVASCRRMVGPPNNVSDAKVGMKPCLVSYERVVGGH